MQPRGTAVLVTLAVCLLVLYGITHWRNPDIYDSEGPFDLRPYAENWWTSGLDPVVQKETLVGKAVALKGDHFYPTNVAGEGGEDFWNTNG